MDYTYNIISSDLPVLVFGASDRCRSFMPVAIEITKNESYESISSFYEHFSEMCAEFNIRINVKCLITDLAPQYKIFAEKKLLEYRHINCWSHVSKLIDNDLADYLKK